VECADKSRRLWARRFLTGLSADELQFIAEFLGASILDPAAAPLCPSRAELARCIEHFALSASPHSPSPDEEHKMILLLEYLCRCALPSVAEPLRA
jgi:hypothetical protein